MGGEQQNWAIPAWKRGGGDRTAGGGLRMGTQERKVERVGGGPIQTGGDTGLYAEVLKTAGGRKASLGKGETHPKDICFQGQTGVFGEVGSDKGDTPAACFLFGVGFVWGVWGCFGFLGLGGANWGGEVVLEVGGRGNGFIEWVGYCGGVWVGF